MEEEAWNAYPYTKTRYKCPFIEKFLLEVETKYHDDPGDDDCVFSLSKNEKAQRTVGKIIIDDCLLYFKRQLLSRTVCFKQTFVSTLSK